MKEAQTRAKWEYTTFLTGNNSLVLQKRIGSVELNRRAAESLAVNWDGKL